MQGYLRHSLVFLPKAPQSKMQEPCVVDLYRSFTDYRAGDEALERGSASSMN
jgi:hypothetical protein